MYRTRRKYIAGSILAIAILAVGLVWIEPHRSHKLETCAHEIGCAFERVYTLTSVADDVYYGCTTIDHRELHYRALKSGRTESIGLSAPIMRVFTASPGNRYLLLKTVATDDSKLAGNSVPREFMNVLDCSTHRATVAKEASRIGKNPVWFSSHCFAFTGASSDENENGDAWYVVDTENSSPPKKLSLQYPFVARILTNAALNWINVGDMQIAAGVNGEIMRLDMAASGVEQLSEFQEQFSSLEWLRFSKDIHRFMFCSTKKGCEYRNLFTFDPVSKKINQLTTEHTYNGQWLTGEGYAYIGNCSNSFYLALRPENVQQWTNLFREGFVERYGISEDGQKVYIVASTNAEPRALWLYDIPSRNLTMLLAGNEIAFRETSVIRPREMHCSSFDGLAIPYYLFEPKELRKGERYPLVVYLPPKTAQCSRGYELQPQLLANLGLFYAGVNYRGIDGYGNKYSALWNADAASRDIVCVTQNLLRDPRIDPDRIALVSMSASSELLPRVLRLKLKGVRAAVFGSPVPLNLSAELPSPNLWPRVLMTIGVADPNAAFGKEFQTWARTHTIDARVLYIDGLGHSDTPQRKARVKQEVETARFLLANLKS